MIVRGLLIAALLLGPVNPSWAQSPLVAELESFATRYHEDPPKVDRLREGLTQAAKADPRAGRLPAPSRACFLWGSPRPPAPGRNAEACGQGREAAKKAIELAPRSAAAHFWYGTNTGRWGQTKGVVRSLFLLPTVQEE